MQLERDGYVISDERARLDVGVIWEFLRSAYWSPGVARDVVERSIEGSLAYGLYAPDGSQAGFGRVVTDGATFAWLADVFVLEPHRGKGLGVWLVETILGQPELRDLRVILLGTMDAHGLYERFGFERAEEGRYMTKR